MNQDQPFHVPVLLEESIQSLNLTPGDIVVDGTFGGGGHSRALHAACPDITLICVDLDESAKERFDASPLVGVATFVPSNFKDADAILAASGQDHADKVLLDLGTSTFQLLQDDRGFSFNTDTPLRMTFAHAGSHTGITAWDIANEWEESSIADVIYAYGEDRASRKIARAIVDARAFGSIDTAKQLADVILSVIPKNGRTHPATKTFQAFRIAVNDELAVIPEALNAWWARLRPGGRISVITFHSLEDRVVKQWMKAAIDAKHLTKKPLPPSRQEQVTNPRSRSAKLRTIQKL